MCKDCKAILCNYLETQHGLLVIDIKIRGLNKKKITVGDLRVRRRNLIKDNTTKLLKKVKAE